MISKIFREYIDNHENGLGIIELPTSIGKTFSTFECIAQYTEDWAKYRETHKRNGNFRQIIVVTPLKKNLQNVKKNYGSGGDKEMGGLEKAYHRHGRYDRYREEVLFLDSLTEILRSNVELLEGKSCAVPYYLQQLDCYQNLVEKASLIKSEILQNDQNLFSLIAKDANKLYFEFRNMIVPAYKKEKKIEKPLTLTDIADMEGYSWIFQLYPDLLIPRVKVILMSFAKLLDGRVYEKPSCAFISDKFLKNKIVIIDEFDSTKMTVKNSLAEEQAKHKVDFLQLFNDIYTGSKNKWSSDSFGMIEKNMSGIYNFDEAISRAERRRRDYKLDHAYQTDGVLRDESQSFIFRDNATRTISKTAGNLQVIARETGEGRVALLLSHIKDMQEGDFFLEGTIRWITGFLRYFAQFVHKLASQYEQQENKEKNEKLEALMSTEDAFRSYLYKFGISRAEYVANPQTAFLLNLADASKMSQRWKKDYDGYDFFMDGFTYYSLMDAAYHNDNTIISMVDIPHTAESIMAKMCNSALVLGLSATASIPSVTGNYNLDWLSDNVKDYNDVVDSSEELQKEVNSFLQKRYAPYREGKINVNVITLENRGMVLSDEYLYSDDRSKSCAILSEFSDRVAIRIENIIKGSLLNVKEGKKNYCALRYYNLLKVMRDFASKKHMQSLLYLGCKSVDRNTEKEPTGRYEFDQCVIDNMVKAVNFDLGLEGEEKIKAMYIYSKGFESSLNEIKQCLSDVDEFGNPKVPERIIIVSAYQSVATGQNLQYPAPDKYKNHLVRLHPRAAEDETTYTEKDIDGIYLGDITHIVSNFSQDKLSEKDLIMDIFQAEELNANWEITPEQKEKNIKDAFQHMSESYPKSNDLRKCESIRSERSRMVIQAVGRIGRSNQRCKDINIYIDSSVLNELHQETLQRRFTSPEIEAILSAYLGNTNSVITDEQAIILNRAATISDRTAEYINSRRKAAEHEGKWDTGVMRWWEDLREIVKKYPTATEDIRNDIAFIKSNYIDNGGIPINSYLFSVNNRYYEHQRVWFDTYEKFLSAEKAYKPYTAKDSTPYIAHMNEENSRLAILFKYPGLHTWWVGKGYADHIEAAPYIMSPFIYTEIYKGTIGETAGRYICEAETGLHLQNIEDPQKFEKADFVIAEHPNEYVDFKHYSPATLKDGTTEFQKILRKLEVLEGKRMYIINTVKAGPANLPEPTDTFCDGRIIVIRWMIDAEGNVNPDIKKKLLYHI